MRGNLFCFFSPTQRQRDPNPHCTHWQSPTSQRLNRSQLLKRFVVREDQNELNAFLDQFKQQQHNTNTLSPSGIEARIKPIDLNKIITLRIEAVVTELSHDRPSIIAIVANNITHEKEQQERINHLAFFDTLTGLRNRFSFEQELNNAEAGLQRKDYRLAIFTLDVNNFKFLKLRCAEGPLHGRRNPFPPRNPEPSRPRAPPKPNCSC